MPDMPKIEIMDTTLRDGEQTPGVAFNSEEKYEIAKMLFNIGVDRIEVASALAVEEDRKAVVSICELARGIGRLESIEVLGFIDYTRSIDWIYECGARTVNLLAKGSKSHCEGQLKKTLEEHIKDIQKTVDYALSKGMRVNVYLEDWSGGMKEENPEEHVMPIIESLTKMGIERIMLPDTRGILFPDEVYRYLSETTKRFPKIRFDFHAHNDRGLATANTLEAIRAKINGIHVTLNGLGERSGNCSLYEIVANANKMFKGIFSNIEQKQFKTVSTYVEGASGKRVPDNAPVVGKNAFTQTAGVHAHGDLTDVYGTRESAETFGREPEYALGKQAGKSSIAMNLKQMGITNPKKYVVERLTERVRELGERKQNITREDLLALYLDEIDQTGEKLFEVLEIKPEIGLRGTKTCYTKVRMDQGFYEGKGEGDGGFDAFMKSIREICGKINIGLPRLVDYDLRIPPGGGTDALVETTIEWENGNRRYRTTGVDSDQLISSIRAAEKMVNLVLMGYK